MSIEEDCLEIDELVEKIKNDWIKSVDWYCGLMTEIQNIEKEEKLKKYQMGIFEDLEFVKNFGKRKRKK